MEFCEQSNEPDARSILVDIYFCLGIIAFEINAHSTSRKHKEIALELQLQTRKALDVVDLKLTRCHSELGVALIVDGDYDAAVSALLESLLRGEQFGVYPYNWVAQVNLGLAYVLQGKLVEADKPLMAVHDSRETMFGKEDTESYRLAVKTNYAIEAF